MAEPGKRLRAARERLRLKYRDVEEASQWIANQHGNHAYLVGISRLADIENKGTTPSLFRLYSLCAIYRIKYPEALSWYGIILDRLPADAAHFAAHQTKPFDVGIDGEAISNFPLELDAKFDFRQTDHLSRSVREWGKLPLTLMNGLDIRKHRYAFIGTNDWSMHPIIPPGSFIQLDERKRRIPKDGWNSEYERPIYFLEHRGGFTCGWCSQSQDLLIVQPHHSSEEPAAVFQFPGEIEVIGQVIAIVMRLDQVRKRHIRS